MDVTAGGVARTAHPPEFDAEATGTIPQIGPVLRQLIDVALRSKEAMGRFGAPDDGPVLLDLHVDGVRCVLSKVEDEAEFPSASLSPREQEIARMVARGCTNKTIAAVLEISMWTVSTHLRRIYAKFGVGSRAAMVAKILGGDRLH